MGKASATTPAEGMARAANLEKAGGGVPFSKGVSGNPGGRPSIAKAVEAATGKSTSEVTAEMFKLLYDAAHECDPRDKDEGASWRHAVTLILGYLVAKPKEVVEVTSPLTDEQYEEELRIIAREKIRAMAPEDRLRLLDPAPDATIQ